MRDGASTIKIKGAPTIFRLRKLETLSCLRSHVLRSTGGENNDNCHIMLTKTFYVCMTSGDDSFVNRMTSTISRTCLFCWLHLSQQQQNLFARTKEAAANSRSFNPIIILLGFPYESILNYSVVDSIYSRRGWVDTTK